jgi:hypothetical protein
MFFYFTSRVHILKLSSSHLSSFLRLGPASRRIRFSNKVFRFCSQQFVGGSRIRKPDPPAKKAGSPRSPILPNTYGIRQGMAHSIDCRRLTAHDMLFFVCFQNGFSLLLFDQSATCTMKWNHFICVFQTNRVDLVVGSGLVCVFVNTSFPTWIVL